MFALLNAARSVAKAKTVPLTWLADNGDRIPHPEAMMDNTKSSILCPAE
jgi:hypothetical protein